MENGWRKCGHNVDTMYVCGHNVDTRRLLEALDSFGASEGLLKGCQWEPFWSTLGQELEKWKLCSSGGREHHFVVRGCPDRPGWGHPEETFL